MSDELQSGKKSWYAALLVVFGIALFLRVWHLPQQGLFYYDEAWYRLTAQTYLQLPQWYHLIQTGLTGEQAFEQVYHWGFYPQIAYKPTYLLCLMLADSLFGIYNPISGAMVSLLSGLGIVILVFCLIRKLTNENGPALAGAFMAAISGLEMSYSRLTFPHQLAACSLLLFIYFYLKRLTRFPISLKRQYVYGIAAGLLLTMHDLMLPVILVLTGFEICFLIYRYQRDWKSWLLRSGLFTLGVATPLVFWQVVTVLLREFFKHTLGKRYVDYYFRQVFEHVTLHKVTTDKVLQESDYLYFFKILQQTEGNGFLILLGLGTLMLLYYVWREKKSKLIFFSLLFFTFLGLISIYPSKVLRLVLPFMPMFIITAGIGLHLLHKVLKRLTCRTIAAGVSILILILFSIKPISYCLAFTRVFSGYQAVSQDLTKLTDAGVEVATPYNFPLYTFYMQKKVFGFKSQAELEKLIRNRDVRYVVFDFEQLYKLCPRLSQYCTFDPERIKLLQIEENPMLEMEKVYPNPYKANLTLLLESHYSYDMAKELIQNRNDYHTDMIRLYKVKSKS